MLRRSRSFGMVNQSLVLRINTEGSGWWKSPPSPSPKPLAIIFDRQLFDQINLDPGGVIVTEVGDNCDFVSRFFNPQASILEDPVTGSAHCSLIPFWAKRLNKIVIISSHIFSTLSETCDEIHLLRKGEQIKSVQKSEFKNLEQEMKEIIIGNRIEKLELK